jgi:tetratricopeptide (TPR) repeat protein
MDYMPQKEYLLLLILTFCGITGCSTTTPQAPIAPEEASIDVTAETDEAAEPELSEPEYPLRPFDKETLYQLLVAEVAGYRKNFDVALENYAQQAIKTRDIGVVARATRLATFLKRDDVALQTSQLWAALEPDNIEPHRHAADQLTRAGDLTSAVRHMEAVKRLGGLANFNLVAYRAANLDQQSRDTLLEMIEVMLLEYPDVEQLLFSKAVLLDQSGLTEQSLAITEQLLGEQNDINVIILRVSALRKLSRGEESIELLETEAAARPDHKRLKVFFARVLFDEGMLDKAREQYEEVLVQVPRDGDIMFALALIALEQGEDMRAAEYFNRMVAYRQRAGEAHYYLGTITEKTGDYSAAIAHYKQAGTGYEFLPAKSRIASIMAKQDKLDDFRIYLQNEIAQYPEERVALTLLEAQTISEYVGLDAALDYMNEILAADPDNVDYLYYRAMTGEKANNLLILEQDLRHILDLQPDNADAMNALGYTLTDKTDRHMEALELITKALEIKPNEAAFIDSIGWVYYRLEDYEQAITFLRRALDLFPNDEVAAHLGEVLWVMGEKSEAYETWRNGLKLAPESKILKEVMDRFQSIDP